MTEPGTDIGPLVLPVPINGRNIMVRRLSDVQMAHMLRHARILQSDNVARGEKLDSFERLFRILHTVVVEDADRVYLTELEENGEIELKDLMPFISVFGAQEPEEKPKARRGRPPKNLQR